MVRVLEKSREPIRALKTDKQQVMIRPRPGSFIYTPPEVDTMFADIAAAREAGAAGVVFGCLDENGDVDLEITTKWVDS
jgi:copper homeostasis protein